MQSNSFKTSYITPEAANKQWVVVDAAGQTLHLICEVSDKGYLYLKSYQRVIIVIE